MASAGRLALLAALSLASFSPGRASAQGSSAPPASAGPSAPSAPLTPLGSGLEALRTSDYARAEKELAAIRGKDAPAAQLGLARTMLATGRYADAERVARQVAGTPQERLAAIAVRAQALFATGKVAEATKLLEASKDATGPAARRVRLLLGEYRIAAGHRADADEPLMKIVEEYNDGSIANGDAEGLAIVGRAAHLLRSAKDANTAFNES
jgi:cellulose synthase operon protein C